MEASIGRPAGGDVETCREAIACCDASAGGLGFGKLQKSSRRRLVRRTVFGCRRSLKIVGMLLVAATFLVAIIGWPGELIDDTAAKGNLMTVLFLIGLVLVVLEDHVGVNKAAVMLIVSASMWTFLAAGFHPHESQEGHEALQASLKRGLEDVGGIILFLLPAMGVVESIDHFDGFCIVTLAILRFTRGRPGRLMPVLCLLTFFMSAVIDNLTATIVALKLLRHVIKNDRHLRHTIGGLVVIAANAGGAWSPVGDVTTTMLWLQGKITVYRTVSSLFLPSLAVGVVPMLGLTWQASREARRRDTEAAAEELGAVDGDTVSAVAEEPEVRASKVVVLALGVACIIMVPALKMMTGLPPYLGMLLALGILWFVTDTVTFQNFARSEEKDAKMTRSKSDLSPVTPSLSELAAPAGSVVEALRQMDLTGLLFFAGVLLAVGALDTAGVLEHYAEHLVRLCGNNPVTICTLLGISSAVVDNVPLVQAAVDMFGESTPVDDPLWQLVALTAGTGGSILSVGSIAGVTLMTMEGVGYIWYCRRMSLWAFLGFGAGIGVYQLQRMLA